MISENNDTNMIVLPWLLGPNKVLNSEWRLFVREFHKKDLREGIAQNKYGRTDRPIMVDSQLRGRFMIEEAGSNLENKLAIIFRLKFHSVRLLVLLGAY